MNDSSATDHTEQQGSATAGERVVTFDLSGDFRAMYAAEEYLEKNGFSVGRCQRGSPRGIMRGDWDIQKWRNLRDVERRQLHGKMAGDMRNGPVVIEFFPGSPAVIYPDAKTTERR